MLVRYGVVVLLFLAVGAGNLRAQPTAGDTSGVQAVYDRVSLAYELGDVDAVADAYAEDARYLLPDEDRGVITGRDSIRAIFDGFFEAVALRQSELTIEFRFLDRRIDERVAYDVGYYRVRVLRDGTEMSASTGKFSTVLRKGPDGTWRFVVDAYSPAPHDAFDALEPTEGSLPR